MNDPVIEFLIENLDEGFEGPVGVEVRTNSGGTIFLFYGRFNVALLPEGLGRSYTDGYIPVRWLNHVEMKTLKTMGIDVRIHQTMYDAIPVVDPSPKDEKPSTYTEKEVGQTPSQESRLSEHIGNAIESAVESAVDTAASIADNAADTSLNVLDAVLSIQSGENAHISTGGKPKDQSKKKGKKRG